MSETSYSRAVLRSLLPDHKHVLVHLDPPDYRGRLADEARRAIFNAAYLSTLLDKERFTAELDRLRALNDAFQAERRIAETCSYLEELHANHVMQ